MRGIVKICGVRSVDIAEVAIDAGADEIGLVHFPRSPRHLELDAAQRLADRVRERVRVVLLLVNPDDALFEHAVQIVRPAMVQLHGDETVERVEALRQRGTSLMKAVRIGAVSDLEILPAYQRVVDRLLLDSKVTSGALPGGTGVRFDWNFLRALDGTLPYMLSGGLTESNVADAARRTAAIGFDVSSGVETAPGIKDPRQIEAFVRRARSAWAERAGQSTHLQTH